MKWNDCAGAYEAFVSLGATCQTAYQLRRLNLRKFAGPLDWFISRSAPNVTRLIRNQFNGLMEFNQLQVIGREPEHYIVRDNGYDIVSYHDFPLIYRWSDAYPDFKQTIDRRVKALFSAAKRGPICLVRIDTTKMEAHQLYTALNKIIPGKFRLLIVNNMILNQEVRHEDWGLPNICSVSVSRGADWKGSDRAWDEIMSGFKLKSDLL